MSNSSILGTSCMHLAELPFKYARLVEYRSLLIYKLKEILVLHQTRRFGYRKPCSNRILLISISANLKRLKFSTLQILSVPVSPSLWQLLSEMILSRTFGYYRRAESSFPGIYFQNLLTRKAACPCSLRFLQEGNSAALLSFKSLASAPIWSR
jgi:hypothetical protein